MLKELLLDQGIPRSAADHLTSVGVAAVHVGDLGLATATDEKILNVARQRGAVVITLDADFHALLSISGAVSPSVVRIRAEGLKGEDMAALLAKVIAAIEPELRAGAVASVTRNRVRVRRLPLTA